MVKVKTNNTTEAKEKVRKTNPESQKIIDRLHKKESKVYTATEFCEGYFKCKTDIEKEQFIKKNVAINKYIPYQVKCLIADSIIDTSTVDNKGNFRIDSRMRYFAYIESIFRYWTNINFKEDELFLEYDLMAAENLIDVIIALIPESEMNEFRTILQMTYDDRITNKYSGMAFLEKVKSYTMPILDNLLEATKNVDINKLIKYLDKQIKK